jgi:hypothetical protein
MAARHSLLNREKFPVLREFRLPRAGVRGPRICTFAAIPLHFGTGILEDQSLNPDLLRAARARARGVTRPAPMFRSAERIGSVDGRAEASLDPAH